MFTIRPNASGSLAVRNSANATREMNRGLSRLASGYRVSLAYDDAAGLSVATNRTAQLRSLQESTRNAMTGRAVIQGTESALAQSASLVTRMRELVVQGRTGSAEPEDLAKIKTELGTLANEVQRVADDTAWNGTKLLDGSKSTMDFQVGAGSAEAVRMELRDMGLDALGLGAFGKGSEALPLDGSSLEKIDGALKQISRQRASLGASSQRLDTAIAQLDTDALSPYQTRSGMTEAEQAEEAAKLSQTKVLANTGLAIQVQASKISQQALRFLDLQKL